jgi:PAS domain S-box-containing protein
MGDLTRNFDWSKTAIGCPDQWPQSLLLTVSMILSSKLPMFLWWGDDLIQFYNDAYIPNLQDRSRHPQALGQRGQECWFEVWDDLHPLIRQVREKGESITAEDQLISVFRNGQLHDAYWTFGYSPVYNDSGEVGGVLVVGNETTEKIRTINALEESEGRFRALADSIPNLAWMANADGWIFWYNSKWYEFTGTTPEQMEGWGWQSVHDPRTLPQVVERWQQSIANGQPFEMVFPIKGANGKFRQFMTRVLPVHDAEGRVYRWFGTNTDITHQIEAAAALKESEERFRTMAESTDIMIAVTDETGQIVYINKAWIDFTGQPQELLLQVGWTNIVHPDERQTFVSSYMEAVTDRIRFIGEVQMMNKDNQYRWVLSQVAPRFRADGTFAGYIGASIDITERKMAEQKARASEQQLRSLVESAPFPIGVYTGKEMRIALANQSIMDVWGKGSEVVGKLFSEILPELKNQEVFQQLDQVYATGIPFHANNQRIELMIDGAIQPFYFKYSFTPLFDASGEVYGVMNTAADVTDLNIAKQKLEHSEENFRNMIHQSPVAMCLMMGPLHQVEIVNDSMLEIWQRPRALAENRPVFEVLPDAQNQGLEAILDEVYRNGEVFRADERMVELMRNGKKETLYVNFVLEPYLDGRGVVLGVLSITIDVTAQVLARQKIEEVVAERTRELADTNRDLQKSNAELAQFAYIASHDLQEPLRKIGTFAQMLESRLGQEIDEQSKSYLSKIYSSTSRMNALIRDVLAYSELVKENEVYSQVDLNQVVEGILMDYELMIEQKGATIRYDKLPVLEAIPLQMAQLFGNMVSNSLKFTRKQIPPVITISSSRLTSREKSQLHLDAALDYHRIRFADNGIGFKKEYADQIFKIFQRLHHKSDYEGTGIGLAMCKKIALNHQGDIDASGSSENGAVFDIFLPVRRAGK